MAGRRDRRVGVDEGEGEVGPQRTLLGRPVRAVADEDKPVVRADEGGQVVHGRGPGSGRDDGGGGRWATTAGGGSHGGGGKMW